MAHYFPDIETRVEHQNRNQQTIKNLKSGRLVSLLVFNSTFGGQLHH